MTNFSIAGASGQAYTEPPRRPDRSPAPLSYERAFCKCRCSCRHENQLYRAVSRPRDVRARPRRPIPSAAPRTIRTHVLAHLTPHVPTRRRASRARPRPCRSAPRAAARRRPRSRRVARVPPAPCAASPPPGASPRRSGAGTFAALHHTAGPVGALQPRAVGPPLTLGGRPATHAPGRGSAGTGVPAPGCGRHAIRRTRGPGARPRR